MENLNAVQEYSIRKYNCFLEIRYSNVQGAVKMIRNRLNIKDVDEFTLSEAFSGYIDIGIQSVCSNIRAKNYICFMINNNNYIIATAGGEVYIFENEIFIACGISFLFSKNTLLLQHNNRSDYAKIFDPVIRQTQVRIGMNIAIMRDMVEVDDVFDHIIIKMLIKSFSNDDYIRALY